MTTDATGPMPSIFLSHGAPPLVDDPRWVAELQQWSHELSRPTAILVISAHWERAPVTIGSVNDATPLVYDFGGFPQRFYDVTYPAPGAPDLARRVEALLAPHETVHHAHDRGLDHGAYVPLTVMFPAADIPVLQVSLPSLQPERLLCLGTRLRSLREEGVLVVASGFTTHGLPFLRDFTFDATPPHWSSEFDEWAREALAAGDIDDLLDFERKAPGMPYAHPSVEHLAPLFVALGTAFDPATPPHQVIDGFWMGLSKRSIQLA